MLGPNGRRANEPVNEGEEARNALPIAAKVTFFIVGPNTASAANPVPKTTVSAHIAYVAVPYKVAHCSA